VLPYANSTESAAEIAHELNVATIMEGSVSVANDRMRIIVRLIDATTGVDLWSESYDRPVTNIFDTEADIARSIAAATSAVIAAADNPAEGADVMGVAPKNLVWVDQSGREETLPFPALPYTSVRLSPDGQRIAVTVQRESSELWALDVRRGSATRLTFDGESARSPIWTPDGRWIVFGDDADGPRGMLYRIAVDGTEMRRSAPLAVAATGLGPMPLAVSPDGTTVVYSGGNRGSVDIAMVLVGQGVGSPLITTRFNESQAAISPDGRWIAYASDETGQSEVFVRPFPNIDAGRWQISVDGGNEPVWGPDGRHLYYRRNGRVAAVDIETSPNFSVGWSSPVLFGRYASTPSGASYDISPDGQRFLMLRDVRATTEDTGSADSDRPRSTGYLQ